jgi:hypothetical protein
VILDPQLKGPTNSAQSHVGETCDIARWRLSSRTFQPNRIRVFPQKTGIGQNRYAFLVDGVRELFGAESEGETMDSRVSLDAYEVPQVFGSFEARDVLGAADGLAGGSVIATD